MIHRPAFCLAASAILVGCVARPLPPLTSAHPASPAAAEVPAPPPSATLTADEGLSVDDTGPDRAEMPTAHGAHGTSAATAPGAAGPYVCPMHPDVQTTQPGRCPKCGMELVPRSETHLPTGGAHAH